MFFLLFVGVPTHEFSMSCHDVIRWRTKLVCPDADQECPRETGASPSSSHRHLGTNSLFVHMIFWAVTICGTATAVLLFVRWRRPGFGVSRQVSEVRGWFGRRLGSIVTGGHTYVQSGGTLSSNDDDHFLISGEIQVPTFGSLQEEDEELILA